MTPSSLLSQPSQPSQPPETQNQGLNMFGSPSTQPAQDSGSSAQQLYTQVASVHSSLKQLATQYPDMASSVDQAIEVLKQGMSKAISSMQPQGSEGTQPSYA